MSFTLNLLTVLLSLLFFILGLFLLRVKGFREPTIWKLYFPPFYEETSERDKFLVYRRLKRSVKIALGWYFFVVGLLLLILLITANLMT